MTFFELVNLEKVRKAILYFIVIAVTLWLQTSVFSRLTILGVKPMFLPAVASAIGLWEGGVWGCMLGLLAGFWGDMAFAGSRVLFLILCAVYGFVSGVLSDYLINRRFVSFMMLNALLGLVTAMCQILPLWIFQGNALPPLLRIGLLQALISLPFAMPVYLAVKKISGKGRLE